MKEWMTAAEIAALKLAGVPGDRTTIIRLAKKAGWDAPEREWSERDNPTGIWRKREASGGGREYHYSVLPAEAQAKLLVVAAKAPEAAGARARVKIAAGEAWGWFEKQPDKVKDKAKRRLGVLAMVEAMVRNGQKKEIAVALIATEAKVSTSSIWGWYGRVAGIDRPHWLPQLADRYTGRTREVEIDFEAWEFFKDSYLRLERPTLTRCCRELRKLAAEKGWAVPSEKTLARKIEREIAVAVRVLTREGPEALKRMYPPQERDRSGFHALQAINGDGHRWDVFVKWPDGEIARPMMIVFQDLYSGKVVGWRVDKSENREAIRLALGDIVEQWGVPEAIWFDNTRAFANKWLTGGAKHRFRWKARDEDPLGMCEQLGIEVRFTLPYSGQSKPVERVFRDFAHDIAKAPAFAGAYTGHSPMDKPANYGSRAVPLDDFLKVVASEIAEWNAREGRRTRVAAGRSFDQAFQESYEKAQAAGLIRTPEAGMEALWLLAAEGITAKKTDGSLEVMGNRFWAEFLHEHRGEKLVVRFDPQNVLAGLRVYSLAGRFLGHVEVWEATGFDDANAAREYGRTRTAWMRGKKMQAAAERKMSALERAAQMPLTDAPPPPAPATVVRPISFGSAALKLGARGVAEALPDDLPDQAEIIELFATAALRLSSGGDGL